MTCFSSEGTLFGPLFQKTPNQKNILILKLFKNLGYLTLFKLQNRLLQRFESNNRPPHLII